MLLLAGCLDPPAPQDDGAIERVHEPEPVVREYLLNGATRFSVSALRMDAGTNTITFPVGTGALRIHVNLSWESLGRLSDFDPVLLEPGGCDEGTRPEAAWVECWSRWERAQRGETIDGWHQTRKGGPGAPDSPTGLTLEQAAIERGCPDGGCPAKRGIPHNGR